ncbi:MAG: ImmA/IrrE family metallo-endopeptidase [Planctomycetota bacterium]
MASAERTIESHVWLRATFSSSACKVNFPKPAKIKDAGDVEAAANQLRVRWGIRNRIIGGLVGLAESNGVIVVDHSGVERDRQFDGLSGWSNDAYPVVVISTNTPDDRIRHTLAHELGHLAMDCSSFSAMEEETFAHRFASAFLVPAEALRSELGDRRRNVSLREFAVLKRKYGMSMQGLVRRALDLAIISQAHYSALCRQFSSMGWRKREPVDFEGDERPTQLLQMTLRALAEGIISEEKAEQICPGCSQTEVVPNSNIGPQQLRKMPREVRMAILEAAATSAESDYLNDKRLTDFEAFDGEYLDG